MNKNKQVYNEIEQKQNINRIRSRTEQDAWQAIHEKQNENKIQEYIKVERRLKKKSAN